MEGDGAEAKLGLEEAHARLGSKEAHAVASTKPHLLSWSAHACTREGIDPCMHT